MLLPDEILLYIFSHLDVKSLGRVRQSSLHYKNLAYDETFLKHYCISLQLTTMFANVKIKSQPLVTYKPSEKSWNWFLQACYCTNNISIGHMNFNNGIYYGEVSNFKPHGYGIYDSVKKLYVGMWKNGLFAGSGILYSDNRINEGIFENNNPLDVITNYVTGDVFIGKYNNGLKLYGSYKWPIGDSYHGQWNNGLFHGYGVYLWSDGRKCSGNWTNGNECGFGIYEFPDGHKYIGNWLDGKRHGFGVLYFNENLLYKGMWVDDSPSNNIVLPFNGFFCLSFPDQRILIASIVK